MPTIVQYLALGNDLALLLLHDSDSDEPCSEYLLEWDVHVDVGIALRCVEGSCSWSGWSEVK